MADRWTSLGPAGLDYACHFRDFSGRSYWGDAFSFGAISSIDYAVLNGADILSNSWGGYHDPLLKGALENASSQGLLIVASAGNENAKDPRYPAYYENVIAVAALDSNDQKAYFSNYGDWVDISAPGVDILSLRAKDTDLYQDRKHFYQENIIFPQELPWLVLMSAPL